MTALLNDLSEDAPSIQAHANQHFKYALPTFKDNCVKG